MGSSNSKDSRRISYENSISLGPQISIKRAVVEADDSYSSYQQEKKHHEIESYEPDTDDTVAYWNERVNNLKAEHQLINQIIDKEYENTMKRANESYMSPQHKLEKKLLKQCFDLQEKMLACYEENSHQPLVCGDAVKAFGKCVDQCKCEE